MCVCVCVCVCVLVQTLQSRELSASFSLSFLYPSLLDSLSHATHTRSLCSTHVRRALISALLHTPVTTVSTAKPKTAQDLWGVMSLPATVSRDYAFCDSDDGFSLVSDVRSNVSDASSFVLLDNDGQRGCTWASDDEVTEGENSSGDKPAAAPTTPVAATPALVPTAAAAAASPTLALAKKVAAAPRVVRVPLAVAVTAEAAGFAGHLPDSGSTERLTDALPEALLKRVKKRGVTQYLVKWTHTPEPSWELEDDLVEEGYGNLIDRFVADRRKLTQAKVSAENSKASALHAAETDNSNRTGKGQRTWQCHRCTYINSVQTITHHKAVCEICGSSRVNHVGRIK